VSTASGVSHDELLLVPYTKAIELLDGRDVNLTVVTPGYPAIGRGVLRVVRVKEDGDSVHLDLSYDDYDRLQ
jgi:hypothetical protein